MSLFNWIECQNRNEDPRRTQYPPEPVNPRPLRTPPACEYEDQPDGRYGLPAWGGEAHRENAEAPDRFDMPYQSIPQSRPHDGERNGLPQSDGRHLVPA